MKSARSIMIVAIVIGAVLGIAAGSLLAVLVSGPSSPHPRHDRTTMLTLGRNPAGLRPFSRSGPRQRVDGPWQIVPRGTGRFRTYATIRPRNANGWSSLEVNEESASNQIG
jgi:hypothetical protein